MISEPTAWQHGTGNGSAPSPVHSAFINRPLRRSTSQTSTSTFRSNISAAPPAIPPLDLRPNFQNAVGVPNGPNSPALAPAPRKSRLPAPALPTVIGSPRQANKVSVIYEDGASARTGSFITAPSVNTPDVESVPAIFISRDYALSATDGTDTEETDVTQRAVPRPFPEGLDDVDFNDAEFGLRPTSRTSLRPSTRSGSLSTERRSFRGGRSRSTSPGSESFLHRRWLKGMSFGSDRFVLPPSAQQSGRQRRVSHAYILFWVGFVAPWCWLIGGWLLTTAGEVSSDGLAAETGPVLPLWHKGGKNGASQTLGAKGKEKEGQSGVPVPEKVRAINGAAERRIKAKSWYPLMAPSLESLTPSTGSGTSTRKLKRCLPGSRGVDPWIQRCRIAAAASGVLIFAAFVVAIVLVAGCVCDRTLGETGRTSSLSWIRLFCAITRPGPVDGDVLYLIWCVYVILVVKRVPDWSLGMPVRIAGRVWRYADGRLVGRLVGPCHGSIELTGKASPPTLPSPHMWGR